MNFAEALEALEQGKHVARRSWEEIGDDDFYWLFATNRCVYYTYGDTEFVWECADSVDFFAKDWAIVENGKLVDDVPTPSLTQFADEFVENQAKAEQETFEKDQAANTATVIPPEHPMIYVMPDELSHMAPIIVALLSQVSEFSNEHEAARKVNHALGIVLGRWR